MPLVERDVMLRTIDWQWMEYLTQMEHFREGIGLRAYGQRDPLVEYKNEAFEMFNELRERIQGSIVSGIFRVQVQRNAAAASADAGGAAGRGERTGRAGRRGRPAATAHRRSARRLRWARPRRVPRQRPTLRSAATIRAGADRASQEVHKTRMLTAQCDRHGPASRQCDAGELDAARPKSS